jgi:hypothetical protein
LVFRTCFWELHGRPFCPIAFPHLLDVEIRNPLTATDATINLLEFQRGLLATYEKQPILTERAIPLP